VVAQTSSASVAARGSQAWSRKAEYVALGALVLAGIGLRLFLLKFHPWVEFDGAYYVAYFRDASWHFSFHPGYPLAVQLFHLVVPDDVLAARLVSVVSGGLLAVPLFYLVRSFAPSRTALIATIVVVLNPLVIRYGAMTMSEALFMLCQTAALCCAAREKPLLFGWMSGMAYLVRPEALVCFLAVVLLWALKKRDGRYALQSTAMLLLIMAPYLLYLKATTGDWSLTPKTSNIRVYEENWKANNARESIASGDQHSLAEGLQSGISLYPKRFLGYGNLLLVYGGIPLVLLGLIGAVRLRNILLAGLPMFFILPLFGLDMVDRFVLPYIPVLGVFSVLFLEQLRNPGFLFIGSILMLVSFIPTAGHALKAEEGTAEFCSAGLAMRAVARPNDLFVDRKPYTAFYAGGRLAMLPNDPADTVLAYSRRIGARYLVVSARVVRVFRPQLNFLLYSDTTLSHMHLKTAYVSGVNTGYGIRVIEIPQ
jgi:hypothetical protein